MATLDSGGDRYTSIVPVNLNSRHNGSNETHHYCPIPLSLPLAHSDEPRKHRSPSERSGTEIAAGVIDRRINRRIPCSTPEESGPRTIDRKVGTVAITDFPPLPGDALTFEVVTNVGLTRGSITSIYENVYLSCFTRRKGRRVARFSIDLCRVNCPRSIV